MSTEIKKEEKKFEIPELVVSYSRKEHRLSKKISLSKDAADFVRELYREGEIDLREHFLALYLSRSNRILGYYRVSIGGVSGTVVDPKILLGIALKCLASGIIIAHNHPSGQLKPSEEDIRLTKKIKEAASLMDIILLDHIIVTNEGFYSFADEGLNGIEKISENSVSEPEIVPRTLTHGSLFSGIGGFELAAKNAGIPTLWNCEIEKFCRDVLKINFPLTKQYKDILTLKHPEKVDIISGGFPCQDISAANAHAKGIKGKKSGLWREMARIIREVRPRYVIIENSPRLVGLGLEKILFDLSEIGYDVQWECLQAGQFGFPHKRERIYIVAYSPEVRQQYASMVRGGKNISRRTEAGERNNYPKIFEQSSCLEFIKERKKKIHRMPEPEFCRMDDGIPSKLDRIGGLGNAIVPEVAEYIFKRIMEIEKAVPNGFTKISRRRELELAAGIVRIKYLKAA